MNIAQITAILYLLVAFGVPNTQVDTVRTILINSQNTAQQGPVSSTVPTEVAGSSVPSGLDCTPTLEASVQRTSVTDVVFMGTSTLPVGCQIDTSTVVNLQTPTVLYKGTIGSWLENNNHIKIVQGEATQFTYSQGWGPALATSTFTWYVGDSSITAK